MAQLQATLMSVSIVGIAEPHRSAVEAILRGARQGLFTVAEAELLIDRVRTHVTVSPLSNGDSLPAVGGGHTSGVLPAGPDRTHS
ncbi:hypothetical protein EV192_120114 [Actinocrispum wychmicini]|uniref:Uncharacterized protein n=1 Tax=Actinocrispum wychmicini TaxID=1213861 RepID=A0A4R2IPK7_9PSEU|nr:hypothetical protein EV192_120114 [Actinocrispum wychmicini]